MILDEPRQIDLSFKGSGSKLLGILLLNALLTCITIGLYYPWAKAKIQQYMHSETEMEGARFVFHGTGQEMFIGFVKSIGLIAALFATMYLLIAFLYMVGFVLAIVLYLTTITLATPYAIHGSLKYRSSRTSWKKIRFGYRGKFGEFAQQFILGFIFTLLSFGIYAAWFVENQRKYIIGNLRFGNISFSYNGQGKALFFLTLKGILLTICTLGVYFFWYNKDAFNFYIKNLSASQNDNEISFRSNLTGGALFMHTFTNILLIVFTLGIGFSWAIVRTQRFIYSNIIVEGIINEESLINTEEEYTDAMGEGLLETMDIAL